MTDKPTTNQTGRGWIADLCAVAGLGLLSYGAWLVYVPAGAIVPGVVLLGVGIVGALRGNG